MDVESGYRGSPSVTYQKTFNDQVQGDLGETDGFYSFRGVTPDQPVLVSGTDGVGTKLKIAFADGQARHRGHRLWPCAPTTWSAGALPLPISWITSPRKTEPERIAQIVSGVGRGCCQAGAALIGEAAEMPGMYTDGEVRFGGFW